MNWPGGGRVHDGEVLRWERSVPHELRTNLEFAAQEKAILPVAPAPQLQSQGCTTALQWVNTLPDAARHTVIKHSQQVERAWVLESSGQQLLRSVHAVGARPAEWAPRGGYHLLKPQVDVIKDPTCWTCQPKMDDAEWSALMKRAQMLQLAEAGHPLPEPPASLPPLPAPVPKPYEAHWTPPKMMTLPRPPAAPPGTPQGELVSPKSAALNAQLPHMPRSSQSQGAGAGGGEQGVPEASPATATETPDGVVGRARIGMPGQLGAQASTEEQAGPSREGAGGAQQPSQTLALPGSVPGGSEQVALQQEGGVASQQHPEQAMMQAMLPDGQPPMVMSPPVYDTVTGELLQPAMPVGTGYPADPSQQGMFLPDQPLQVMYDPQGMLRAPGDMPPPEMLTQEPFPYPPPQPEAAPPSSRGWCGCWPCFRSNAVQPQPPQGQMQGWPQDQPPAPFTPMQMSTSPDAHVQSRPGDQLQWAQQMQLQPMSAANLQMQPDNLVGMEQQAGFDMNLMQAQHQLQSEPPQGFELHAPPPPHQQQQQPRVLLQPPLQQDFGPGSPPSPQMLTDQQGLGPGASEVLTLQPEMPAAAAGGNPSHSVGTSPDQLQQPQPLQQQLPPLLQHHGSALQQLAPSFSMPPAQPMQQHQSWSDQAQPMPMLPDQAPPMQMQSAIANQAPFMSAPGAPPVQPQMVTPAPTSASTSPPPAPSDPASAGGFMANARKMFGGLFGGKKTPPASAADTLQAQPPMTTQPEQPTQPMQPVQVPIPRSYPATPMQQQQEAPAQDTQQQQLQQQAGSLEQAAQAQRAAAEQLPLPHAHSPPPQSMAPFSGFAPTPTPVDTSPTRLVAQPTPIMGSDPPQQPSAPANSSGAGSPLSTAATESAPATQPQHSTPPAPKRMFFQGIDQGDEEVDNTPKPTPALPKQVAQPSPSPQPSLSPAPLPPTSSASPVTATNQPQTGLAALSQLTPPAARPGGLRPLHPLGSNVGAGGFSKAPPGLSGEHSVQPFGASPLGPVRPLGRSLLPLGSQPSAASDMPAPASVSPPKQVSAMEEVQDISDEDLF